MHKWTAEIEAFIRESEFSRKRTEELYLESGLQQQRAGIEGVGAAEQSNPSPGAGYTNIYMPDNL